MEPIPLNLAVHAGHSHTHRTKMAAKITARVIDTHRHQAAVVGIDGATAIEIEEDAAYSVT